MTTYREADGYTITETETGARVESKGQGYDLQWPLSIRELVPGEIAQIQKAGQKPEAYISVSGRLVRAGARQFIEALAAKRKAATTLPGEDEIRDALGKVHVALDKRASDRHDYAAACKEYAAAQTRLDNLVAAYPEAAKKLGFE